MNITRFVFEEVVIPILSFTIMAAIAIGLVSSTVYFGTILSNGTKINSKTRITLVEEGIRINFKDNGKCEWETIKEKK